MTELQIRVRKKNNDLASFREDLRQLADKAYPDLQEEARECFTLNQYLARLDNPQVAFSMRQATPETVDEAVKLTLEMEFYLQAAKQPSKLVGLERKFFCFGSDGFEAMTSCNLDSSLSIRSSKSCIESFFG